MTLIANAVYLSNKSIWTAIKPSYNLRGNIMNTKLRAKEVRKELKALYPEFKFSVTSDYNHIRVDIISGNIELDLYSVNKYPFGSVEQWEAKKSDKYTNAINIHQAINSIVSKGQFYHNADDVGGDYSNCNFYTHVSSSEYTKVA